MKNFQFKKIFNILLLSAVFMILGLISKGEVNHQKSASGIIPSAHADEPAPPSPPAGDPGCGWGCASGEGCEGCGGCP